MGSDSILATKGFIGFTQKTGAHNVGAIFRQLLQTPDDRTVRIPDKFEFFTMLPEMEAYRKLIQDLGTVDAIAALTTVNDLVTLNEFNSNPEIIDLANKTEVFAISFMRNAESFFAYKNAGILLRGLENEKTGVLSSIFAIRFQLPGRKNEHDLKFVFDHSAELPKRISIIIGKNGVGKSQTLGRIARAALDGSSVLTNGSMGGRPLINRLLAFAPTNEAESVFPMDRRKKPHIWYQRYSINRSRRSKRNDYVSDLIVQVARSTQIILEKSRWDIFMEAISTITDSDQIHLTTTSLNSPHIALKKLSAGNEQKILERFSLIDVRKEPTKVLAGEAYPLSSGEISFLKFSAQACLHIENGSLLLLDEPETHLHPNFISRFVSLLDNLLSLTGSAAIIATHSAYFVREVFSEQVTVLRIDDENIVYAEKPTLRTFGADVGAISYFVFGEDQPSKLATEVEKILLKSNLSWPEIYEKYKNDFSLEILNSLRAAFEKERGK